MTLSPYYAQMILRKTTSKRIRGVKNLRPLGSDEELRRILLDSILPVLLEFQRIGTAEENEDLEWDMLAGPLANLKCPQSLNSQVALSFLDTYARRRDELWAETRLNRHPSLSSLGHEWPRGLPVQYLMPSSEWTKVAVNNAKAAPFVSKRVEDLIFAPIESVLTEIPTETNVIGKFVDSLSFIIDAYVNAKPPKQRASVLLEIWSHYSPAVGFNTGALTELRRHLSNRAVSQGLDRIVGEICPPPISPLPDIATVSSGPIEWNPQTVDNEPQTVKSSRLTKLQLSIRANWNMWTDLRAAFFLPAERDSPSKELPKIWSIKSNLRRLSLRQRESLAISSILFLNSRVKSSSSVLSKPFPYGAAHARYPAVYLHPDFLSTIKNNNLATETAIKILRQLVGTVPATLLSELATSCANAIRTLPESSSEYPRSSKGTFQLIKTLQLSDKPQLAAECALNAVRYMPQASSWHRYVFSVQLTTHLCFGQVQSIVKGLSEHIISALKEWKAARAGEAEIDNEDESSDEDEKSGESSQEEATSTTTKTPVKVTTMKMLAELIKDGRALSISAALDILQSLFTTTGQVNVRTNIILALFDLLQKTVELGGGTSKDVYASLLSFTEAAAGPSERKPVLEEEWLAAENGGPLPDVHQERPLLNYFVAEAWKFVSDDLKEAYVRDALLPLLESSARQHNRWMRIFLNRIEHCPERDSISDFGPFLSGFEHKTLATWSEYLPKEYLAQHRHWSLNYLGCCRLHNLLERLKASGDASQYSENAVQHIKDYFKRHDNRYVFGELKQLLRNYSGSKVTDGITHDDIADEYYKRISIILREPLSFDERGSHVSLALFDEALKGLSVVPDANEQSNREKIYRLLERIAVEMENLRTPEWLLGDQSRDPPVLPHPLKLQCPLAVFANVAPGETKVQKLLRRFGEVIKQVAASPTCLLDIYYLKESINTLPPDQLTPFALNIGHLSGEQNVVENCVRIELAQSSLLDVSKFSRAIRDDERMFGLLEEWKRSPTESIRLAGVRGIFR